MTDKPHSLNKSVVVVRRILRGMLYMWWLFLAPLYVYAIRILPDQWALAGALAPLAGFFIFAFYMVGRSLE